MHYAEFKQKDPDLLHSLIVSFPFATIAVNGTKRPIVAQAPLTLRDNGTANGELHFHIARQNPITNLIDDGTWSTIVVNGPSAHVSPSWYTGQFPEPNSDRSRAAPTYDYLAATIEGQLQRLDRPELEAQIADLVLAHEPAGGWQLRELDKTLYSTWCDMLVGYRLPITSFDLTAKLSQEQTRSDKPGIARGLRHRSGPNDGSMALLVENYDGTEQSIAMTLDALTAGEP